MPILIAPIAPPAPQVHAVAASPPAPPAASPVAEQPSLRGANVYVYNVLDIRARYFGRRVIEQIESQLGARLDESGVRSAQLRFKDSPVSLSFVDGMTTGQSFQRAPVFETIGANLGREREFGARYRLIILPANFEQEGAWQTYDIRWLLMDVRSNAIVWTFMTHNRRLTLWRNDENSERRGRQILDRVFEDLRTQAIL